MPTYKTTQRWRTKARQWITRYCGGCCQSCGYNAYIGNLVFHHVATKTYEISRLINSTAAWRIIIAEANKCVLVCSNCHGEIHAGLKECPSIKHNERQLILSEIMSEIPLPLTKKFHKCRCKAIIPMTLKFCSSKCHHIESEKIKWPINLPELVAKSSKRAVAISLGVSDKAIAKRLKKHHI